MHALDQSQAHKNFSEDVHIIKHFNLNPGVHALYAQNMMVNEDSIRPHDITGTVKYVDVMLNDFLDTETPPKGNETSPKCDTIDCTKLHDRGMKDLRAELKERNTISAGNIFDIRRTCNICNPPIASKIKYGKAIHGHEEKNWFI